MTFPDAVRMKCLLWCDRHCCICKKPCGLDIEVHHIDQNGPEEIDNAIPLCYVCHAQVGRYDDQHPRGTKWRPDALKARREQVYEEFTRHLVPPVHYEITQKLPSGPGRRRLPDVGFRLAHLGDSLPVQVLVNVTIIRDGDRGGAPDKDYYAGKKRWRLNPRFAHHGHFEVPVPLPPEVHRLETEVRIVIIDCFEREHALLPVGWVYVPDANAWYFEP